MISTGGVLKATDTSRSEKGLGVTSSPLTPIFATLKHIRFYK